MKELLHQEYFWTSKKQSSITVTIAAGAAMYKLTLNLSLIYYPWVFVAAIVVSEITERLSPNIEPPITAANIRGIGTPLFSASPTAIGSNSYNRT